MRYRALAASIFALLLVTSLTAAPAAAAGPALNFDDDRTPDPYMKEDTLTIATYDMGEMDSALEYYDDDGDVAELPATYNDSQYNPFTFRFDKANASAYDEFPRETDKSVMNTSSWSTSSNAGDSMAVNDVDGTTADGVDAIEVNATIATDGNHSTATYKNFTISSDADKRVLRFVGNVNQLASGAHVEIRAVESDGDYKAAVINSTETGSDDHVIGNTTGDGYVFQEKLADLSTEGSGDGSFGTIDKLVVNASDADSRITIVGLDAESKGEMTLANHDHGNGTVETITERYAGGDMSLDFASLDSMGSEFDDAQLNDLKIDDVRYRFQDLTDEDDYKVEWTEASDYGSYERKLVVHGRLEVPTAIDLSHSGLTFKDYQGFVDPRYADVEIAEDIGDTDFDNISDSDWTDKTDQYNSTDSNVTLDSTVSADQEYAYTATILMSSGEEDTLRADGGQPAGGPVGSGDSGGIIDTIVSFLETTVGKIVTLVMAAVAGLKSGLGRGG